MTRFAAALVALLPAAAVGMPLAGHHAVYRLALQSSPGESVLSATGSMTYDVRDACTGWTTTQHLVIELTNRDGEDVRMVSDYATFESKDGTRLDFHTRQATGKSVTEKLDGSARLDRSGGRGRAEYRAEPTHVADLPPGTLLPVAHTAAIIAAAEAGQHFLAVPLFDGTGEDGAEDTFVTLGKWQAPETPRFPALAGQPSGRVHVAFFDRNRADQTPSYEISMRYFSNGVADELTMDFGDFVLHGGLDRLELRDRPRC